MSCRKLSCWVWALSPTLLLQNQSRELEFAGLLMTRWYLYGTKWNAFIYFYFWKLEKDIVLSTSTWYGIFSFLRLVPSQFRSWTGLFFLPYCRIWGLFTWAFSDFMGFQFQNEFSNMSGLAILLPTCSSKFQCWFHHDKISCMILAAAIISQASLHTNTKRIAFSVCYLFLVYIIAFFFQISWGYIQCDDEIMFHW